MVTGELSPPTSSTGASAVRTSFSSSARRSSLACEGVAPAPNSDAPIAVPKKDRRVWLIDLSSFRFEFLALVKDGRKRQFITLNETPAGIDQEHRSESLHAKLCHRLIAVCEHHGKRQLFSAPERLNDRLHSLIEIGHRLEFSIQIAADGNEFK